MAFWSSWFAPTCTSCSNKIVGVEPLVIDGKKVCPTCHEAAVAAEAKRVADIEARRAAEEAARARFEDAKKFGVDPRSR